MATRNLTEIYINLRTEISRFKAYSLGDSVRSDSPGVLYWHNTAAKTYTVCFMLYQMENFPDDDLFWFNLTRTMTQ